MSMITSELLKKVRHIEIKTRGLVNHLFSGEYHSVFKGKGMDFSEVREYQYGDDIRSIDWNVTARFGHPYIKVFEEERELTVLLVVDLSGSQYFGSYQQAKQQIAAELSAILSLSALKNNDKVGLILFTDTVEKYIPPQKKKTNVLRIIREVLSFEPKSRGTNIKNALEFVNKAVKKRSICFLISDFNDKGYEQVIRITARKHDLIAVKIEDPRENELPSVGLVQFADPESGKEMLIDTGSIKVRSLFYAKVQERKNLIRKIFTAAGIDTINVNTAQSYIPPLVNFFKKRETRL
ncbi:MAG: hypothetical protein AMXMBFR48_14340 [Ignavibacteriales bacterium]